MHYVRPPVCSYHWNPNSSIETALCCENPPLIIVMKSKVSTEALKNDVAVLWTLNAISWWKTQSIWFNLLLSLQLRVRNSVMESWTLFLRTCTFQLTKIYTFSFLLISSFTKWEKGLSIHSAEVSEWCQSLAGSWWGPWVIGS